MRMIERHRVALFNENAMLIAYKFSSLSICVVLPFSAAVSYRGNRYYIIIYSIPRKS